MLFDQKPEKTPGGFIKEEKNTNEQNTKTIIKDQNTKIISCKFCKILNVSIEIFNTFEINVCLSCSYKNIEFITKTEALKNYLLTDSEIKGLRFLKKENTRHTGGFKSRFIYLYLKSDVEEIALTKYESLDAIEDEKEKRILKLKDRKKVQIKKRVKEMRKKTMIMKINEKNYFENKTSCKNHDFKSLGKNNFIEMKECKICGLKIEEETL